MSKNKKNKSLDQNQKRIEYCKKANAPITKLSDGDIWDIVEYFLGDSLRVQSYDNDMV